MTRYIHRKDKYLMVLVNYTIFSDQNLKIGNIFTLDFLSCKMLIYDTCRKTELNKNWQNKFLIRSPNMLLSCNSRNMVFS